MSKINEILKSFLLISIIIYLAPSIFIHIKKEWKQNIETHNKIGYLYIHGKISNASFYREQLSNYFKDSSIKAILLKIESDDAALGSCQAISYDIENFKKEYPKPIISYIENICTSGAYQIAAATDYIVATGSSTIGNIGKKNQTPLNIQQNKMDEEKTVPTNQDEYNLMLENLAENTYQQLTKEIASKRHLQLHKIDQWGKGKIFTGQQAYDLKLIDAIGSKTTAINLIKKNIIPSDSKIEWVTASKFNIPDAIFGKDKNEDADLDTDYTMTRSID